MLRSLLGILLVFVCGLLAVGVTFSASSQGRAEFAFINPVEPRSLDPTHQRRTRGPGPRRAVRGAHVPRRQDAPARARHGRKLGDLAGRPALRVQDPEERALERRAPGDGSRLLLRLAAPARSVTRRRVRGVLFPVRDAEAFNTFASRADSLEKPIAKALATLGSAHPERIPSAAFRAFASEQHLEAAVKGTPDAELQALLKAADAGLPSSRLPALSKALATEAQRLRKEGVLAERRFGRETGVIAVDDHTLVVELNAPTPYFLELTAFYPTYPVPRWIVEKPGLGETWFLPENIVSNGPFRLASWRVGDRIRLEKSDSYWDKDQVRLKTVDALPIENGTTALNMYLTGQADWMPTNSFPADLVDELKKRPDFHKGPALTIYYYRVNTTRKPFSDPRVRKALSMAIDREVITRDVLGIGQEPTFRFVPPGIAGYDPPVPALRHDLAAARALLAEAGFPGGKGFPKFGILFNTMEGPQENRRGDRRSVEAGPRDRSQRLQPGVASVPGHDAAPRLRPFSRGLGRRLRGSEHVPRAVRDQRRQQPDRLGQPRLRSADHRRRRRGGLLEGARGAAARAPRTRQDPGLGLCGNPREGARGSPRGGGPPAHGVAPEAEALLINDDVPVIPIYFYVNNGLIKPRVHGFYKELHDADGRKRPNLRDRHPLRALWVEDGEAHGP